MLLEFRKPMLSDKEWIDELISISQVRGCSFCFGSIFIWSDVYNVRICRLDDFLLYRAGVKKFSFTYPVGRGDVKKAIEAMISDAENNKKEFTLIGLTEDNVNTIETLMPGKFEFILDRDFFDYIYLQSDLAELRGKKYHSKRNHISGFNKSYNWTYEPITSTNLKICCEITAQWEKEQPREYIEDMPDEFLAVRTSLKYFSELGFTGAIIRVDGKGVAFTLGEPLDDETFCTHFEKALAEAKTAYAVINNEFAKNALGEYKYINREEDTGAEGLRKAKLSYKPYELLVKYKAKLK